MNIKAFHVNTLLFVALAVVVFCVPHSAFAFVSSDGKLEVDFQGGGTSLFSNSNNNVAPGFGISKTVTVINHDTTAHDVYTSPTNTSSDGLADVMDLSVQATSSGTTYFNDTFGTFFSESNPVKLGQLAAGASAQYTYTALLSTSTGDAYEGKALGFDLVIGFEDGGSVIIPGGGGGGGGGGTRGGSGTTPTTTPSGIVAGASTTTAPFGLLQDIVGPVSHFIHGLVKGDSTSTNATSVSPLGQITSSTPADLQTASGTAAAATATSSHCTLVWLLLLVIISFSWSVIEDLFIGKESVRKKLFTYSAVFSGIYTLCLWFLYTSGFLEKIWWAFALAWVIVAASDYYGHRSNILNWDSRLRNGYYALFSIVLIGVALFTSLLCAWVWIPFAIIAGVSLLLLILRYA